MQKSVYAVYDCKAQIFGNPFFALNDGVALRDFSTAATDPASTISQHPVDFSLFKIGMYDDFKGQLMPLEANINLGLASQFTQGELNVS
ncbi:MAG: nonstructural protein [Microviridae sp.]|nr:MAG: nonstructural protein [Microviridae sp.]